MSSELKIVVVTQDDPFYTPVSLEAFLDELDEDVVPSRIICLTPFDDSFIQLIQRAYRLFGPFGFLIQGFSYLYRLALDSAGIGHYSVERVAQTHEVPVDYVESVNDESFVDYIDSENIDILLSLSAPEIFQQPLLATPSWGCINIHTSELPKYKGMMPTFWALYHEETEIGVTAHEMVEQLDAGRIAAQTTFDVTDLDSLHQVLLRGKRTGGQLAAETLSRIAAGNVTMEEMTGDDSYFSFPTAADRKELQSQGWRTR